MKKKVIKSWLTAIMVGLMAGPFAGSQAYATATGSFNDLLPIGQAENVTVLNRGPGSGYAVVTVPTADTFGDAISRMSYTAYQSTTAATLGGTTSLTVITSSITGKVGSVNIPQSWIATGRTIRIKWSGLYTTTSAVATVTFGVRLGTTTVITTGAQTIDANQTTQFIYGEANITVADTGSAGTANGSYNIVASSGSTTVRTTQVGYSTTTFSPSAIDWTTSISVQPFLTWSTTAPTITFRNLTIELLN